MSKMNKWLLSSGLFGLLLALSGCVSTNADGTPKETGMIYRFLVKPLGDMITMLVENFNWSYGWAIIAVTIVVRVIILPLGIHQSRKTMVQSEKMQFLKPQVDIAQANLKKATTREEQMQAQAEMQKIYSENNVSMFGGIGCLPLLIQMPIFSALYFTARYTQGIQNSEFFGVSLGDPSILFVAIAGLSYLAQGYISTIGIPEEQKKNDENHVDRFSIDDRFHVHECTSWCDTLLGSWWGLQLYPNVYHECHHETKNSCPSRSGNESKSA